MALIDEVPRAHLGLELARLEEAGRITEAVQTSRIVGVLGEAEVGKTETIRQALGSSTPTHPIVSLDLDGAASEEHLAFLLARQIATAQLGSAEFSILKVGALIPSSIEAKRVGLAELLGIDGLEEALRDWPSGGYQLSRALVALERLTTQKKDTILWIDHLEAPGLTPRHPLDLDRVLWAIREMVQGQSDMGVVLSGREAVEGQILGSEAAFHQQGLWLSLDNPPPEVWREVATGMKVPGETAVRLARLTGGHPETMLIALLSLIRGRSKRSAEDLLRDLASTSAALAARAMQHARTLHRLGGQVLIQVAMGQGPYAGSQRGESPPQEIRRVLGRLRQAGLVRHDDGWAVVNPLIGIVLRGEVPQAQAPDWDLEDEPTDARRS